MNAIPSFLSKCLIIPYSSRGDNTAVYRQGDEGWWFWMQHLATVYGLPEIHTL